MKKNHYLLLAVSVFMALIGCQNKKQQALQTAYEKEINAWHTQRLVELTKPHGWLSLVALEWLHEGKNSLTSFGTINLDKNRLSVEIENGVSATLKGKKFVEGAVKSDDEKEGPDTIFIGTRANILIKRGERYALRALDSEAATRKQFTRIDRFPVSLKWRIEADWKPYEKPKKLSIETVLPDYKEEGFATGVAVFSNEGKEYQLEPIVDDSQTDYFFIIGDKTNGNETYGAGRFLHMGPPVNGKIVIDFNKATNPPCAFTVFATCPLPPPNNRLPFKVEAGEKKYSHQ
ncbi:MAG: DUF1684 domain-containing protein [Bacteroidota bacterium]|nr:DUF1684 domain-containing protein [Bacteroidota bacterium]